MTLVNNVAVLAVIGGFFPAPSDLVDALDNGSRSALEEVGSRDTGAGLRDALSGPDRRLRIAAARASTGADHGWALLPALATAASGPDRSVATAASHAAARIADRQSRERALDRDIPDDVLRDGLARWRDVGADATRWPDVRVLALEICHRLHAALGADADDRDRPYDRAARLADPEPEVRRAALELLPQPPALPVAAVVERLKNDDDETVAIVAAQIVCEGLAVGDDAAPVLAAITADGLARLRALIAIPDQPPAALLAAARCLAADPDPASAAALSSLANTGPRTLRTRIAKLRRGSR